MRPGKEFNSEMVGPRTTTESIITHSDYEMLKLTKNGTAFILSRSPIPPIGKSINIVMTEVEVVALRDAIAEMFWSK